MSTPQEQKENDEREMQRDLARRDGLPKIDQQSELPRRATIPSERELRKRMKIRTKRRTLSDILTSAYFGGDLSE